MCGVAYLFDRQRARADRRVAMRACLDSQAHRGPDGQGIEEGQEWTLGHRRLSVIDIADSNQPMWDPGGRWCLSYNGEVYNYRELRSALAEKWQFITQGDTEVVLAGLLLEGVDFLQRMEGMWAVVLWDSLEQSLLLTRDRMGKKPLYYSRRRRGFACASELPALKLLLGCSPTEDLDSTADYLRYGFYMPGTTAYEEILEVLPGHWLRWHVQTNRVSQEQYWRLPEMCRVQHKQERDEEQLEAVREAFSRAVGRRLVADVEVGAFLSGGIDSSLVCAEAVSQGQSQLQTFCMGSPSASYDERVPARAVARVLGTRHREGVLDGYNDEDATRLINNHLGQPFGDPSLLPTAAVAKLAASRVKVALSGDGADELFSGYQRYQARAILRWYSRLPSSLQRVPERFVGLFPEPDRHHSNSLLKKAHLFVAAARRHRVNPEYVAPMLWSHTDYSALFPDLVDRGHEPPKLRAAGNIDDVEAMMKQDLLVYLPQDILMKVDRATMAHSLESRAPFLDSELVSLALSLPRRWHRRGRAGKRVLREAFSQRLPVTVWRRRKQGFAVPVGDYIGRIIPAVAPAKLRDCPIDTGALAARWEASKGGGDPSLGMWTIAVYTIWRQAI